MKHLSRDKLAKYHRFSYIPRYYKEEKEAFRFREATIRQQLEAHVNPKEVGSNSLVSRKSKTKSKQLKFLILTGLFLGFVLTLTFMPLSVYTVAALFIFTYAFVKFSKK